MFDEQSGDEEKSEEHAADPPGNGREEETQRSGGRKIEKENAGSGENCSGKKETGAENERDAVLRALETNESDSGKDKRKQTGDGLKISVEGRIGLQIHEAEPGGNEEDRQKAGEVREENRRGTAAGDVGGLAHN